MNPKTAKFSCAVVHGACTASRRCAVRFLKATRGATAVEFALVAGPLLLTIVFLMSVGYIIVMNQSLNYATAKAARMLRTGQPQAAGITTTPAFVQNDLCPLLPALFNCNNIIVYTQTFPTSVSTWGSYPYTVYTSYINSSNTGLVFPTLNTNNSFCSGSGSEYMYLQVLYPVNYFMSLFSSAGLTTTYNGKRYYMIMSTAVFLDEPFAALGTC